MESTAGSDNTHRSKDGPIPSLSKIFAILLLASSFLLARRMRNKLRASVPLSVLFPDEIAAAVCIIASLAFHIPRLLC
ncbi:hypothetical protein KSP40_PGU005050 [Platanthera guangdongensis]|uniref:Uncharacterized protein n=1 Tax=Platanthera guangdongensis TaxID=2320717 RepID=A0ABR2M0Q6_9ASPA